MCLGGGEKGGGRGGRGQRKSFIAPLMKSQTLENAVPCAIDGEREGEGERNKEWGSEREREEEGRE